MKKGREKKVFEGSTLEIANEHLEAWLNAEQEVSVNQSYTIAGRSFTRADLGEIREQIDYWRNMVAELNNVAKHKGRNRIYRVVPRDL